MTDRLGWTLVHFLWQGAILAALLAAVRAITREARMRHAAACAALAAMAAAPLVTFALLGRGAPSGGAVSAAVVPVAAGAAAAVPSPSANTMQWLVLVWLAGVVVFSARLAGGWIAAARLRTRDSRPAPAEWQETLERLMARMNVTRRVRLLVSPRVQAPSVVGWLQPAVLAPVGALTGLAPEHVQALLAHELAHILRNDYLINLLQGVAEALLFYHPAVWWVSRQIRVERELCCDDLAVAVSGDVLTYARALADLEMCRPSRPGWAMAANSGSLVKRIARLVEPSRPAVHTMPAPGAAWVLTFLLLLGLGALGIGGAQVTRGTIPTVSRDTVWMDTVKAGNMAVEVRGLGKLTSPNTAEIKIAETQAKELKPNLVATLDLRANSLVAAIVTRIRPGVQNGTVTVDVQIPGKLPPGVQEGVDVDCSILIAKLTNVIYVGRPVLAKANEESSILKLDPDGKQAVRVKVQFGRSSVNSIQVLSGLQPGDKVILSDIPAGPVNKVYLK
jgi:beta-lactamase regulating signal transducer with metallopeptidase domain